MLLLLLFNFSYHTPMYPLITGDLFVYDREGRLYRYLCNIANVGSECLTPMVGGGLQSDNGYLSTHPLPTHPLQPPQHTLFSPHAFKPSALHPLLTVSPLIPNTISSSSSDTKKTARKFAIKATNHLHYSLLFTPLYSLPLFNLYPSLISTPL